jgi:hypothetical protein
MLDAGRRALTRLAAAALLVAAIVALACGDDGDEPAADDTPAATVTPAAPSITAQQICASAADRAPGNVGSPDLLEISGLAASRSQPGIVWAHNDSGDSARVFAIGEFGAHRGAFTLERAAAIDWEDMAIGPGPQANVDYLYLGDIGDNAAMRDDVVVYRVAEAPVPETPPAEAMPIGGVETLMLRYPDGAHDAEILLIDPANGDLLIVTKDIIGGASGVYRAPASALRPGTRTEMELVTTVDFAALAPAKQIPADSPPLPLGAPRIPTGGDISPDGLIIGIRSYGTVWLWQRADAASPLAQAFASTPCEAPSAIEAQGEALAFDADGRGYYTASEGVNPALHHFEVD